MSRPRDGGLDMSRDSQTGDSVEDFDAWAAEQDWTGGVLLRDATPEQWAQLSQLVRSLLAPLLDDLAEKRRQAAKIASALNKRRRQPAVHVQSCRRCGRVLLRVYRYSHGDLAVPASRTMWLTPGKIFVSDDGRPQLVQDAGWYKPGPWWVEDERADKHWVCCCSRTPIAVERMLRPRRGT